MASFIPTESTSVITEHALSLVARHQGEYFPSGTAIVIGNRLALTAKHVIEDFDDRFDPEKVGVSGINSYSLQACQTVNGYVEMWDVRRIWMSGAHDIAVLWLQPRTTFQEKYQWQGITMQLVPPAVGETISAFGYHSTSAHIEERAKGPRGIELRRSPTTSVGKVIEIHPERRDRIRLHFACFHTDARFDGGMSGGPVFNDAGELCGLVCSSTPPYEEGDDHASYVSLLWPLMGTEIDLKRPNQTENSSYPLVDLARDGIICAKGWERVLLKRDDQGRILQTGFRPRTTADGRFMDTKK